MVDYPAQQTTPVPNSEFNIMEYLVECVLSKKTTAALVQVQKVTTSGDLAPTGQVDVLPLINMIDGVGTNYKHGPVHNLMYFRLQGGKNAVIMDPVVNDIGIAVIVDRDTSAVKANKKQSQPGSFRRWDMSDGIFFPCLLGDKPTSYVQFKSNGTIICGVGESNPCEAVIASDHVQMKKKGDTSLHMTVDVKNGQIVLGMDPVIAPDPFPND